MHSFTTAWVYTTNNYTKHVEGFFQTKHTTFCSTTLRYRLQHPLQTAPAEVCRCRPCPGPPTAGGSLRNRPHLELSHPARVPQHTLFHRLPCLASPSTYCQPFKPVIAGHLNNHPAVGAAISHTRDIYTHAAASRMSYQVPCLPGSRLFTQHQAPSEYPPPKAHPPHCFTGSLCRRVDGKGRGGAQLYTMRKGGSKQLGRGTQVAIACQPWHDDRVSQQGGCTARRTRASCNAEPRVVGRAAEGA